MSKLLGNFHIFIIIIIAYFAWLDFTEFQQNLDSKVNELDGVTSQLEINRQKLGKINIYKKRLEKSREKLEQVRNQIIAFQEKLPTKKDPTAVLEFLSEQADRIRLLETTFKPLGEKNQGMYFIEEFEVQGVGTFQQFLVYLEKMKLQTRVYNITFLELRAAKDNGKSESGIRFSSRFQMLEGRLVFQLYRFNRDSFMQNINLSSEKGER